MHYTGRIRLYQAISFAVTFTPVVLTFRTLFIGKTDVVPELSQAPVFLKHYTGSPEPSGTGVQIKYGGGSEPPRENRVLTANNNVL